MSDQQRRPERDVAAEVAIVTGKLLVETLPERFGIPQETANAVVLEAVMAWLASGVLDAPPAQFVYRAAVGALCEQAAEENARPAPFPPREAPNAATSMFERAAAFLNAVEREALRLLLVEKKSYREIAAEMNVTVRYAKRLAEGAADKVRRHLGGPHAR